jgi:hypothetical protein
MITVFTTMRAFALGEMPLVSKNAVSRAFISATNCSASRRAKVTSPGAIPQN